MMQESAKLRADLAACHQEMEVVKGELRKKTVALQEITDRMFQPGEQTFGTATPAQEQVQQQSPEPVPGHGKKRSGDSGMAGSRRRNRQLRQSGSVLHQ